MHLAMKNVMFWFRKKHGIIRMEDAGIADIAIATFFRNAAFARFRIDATRWPVSAAFVDRVLANDAFQQLKPFEDRMARTPIPQQREDDRDTGRSKGFGFVEMETDKWARVIAFSGASENWSAKISSPIIPLRSSPADVSSLPASIASGT